MMVPASVIIAACDSDETIGACVQSLLGQPAQNLDIVIAADDGKDYAAILAAGGILDGRISHVTTGGVRTGPSHARNCALKAAKHDIIFNVDSDDLVSARYFETMIPLVLACGAAISQVAFTDALTGKPISNKGKPYSSQLLPLEELYNACVHTYASIAFDRRRMQTMWHEGIGLLEDAVFLAECCASLNHIWYQAEPLYCYHYRGGSQCNDEDAPSRFMQAAGDIRELIRRGEVCTGSAHARAVLEAYLARNDRIEMALEAALATGEVHNYQEFIGRHPELIYAPLV